jgi:hypothetical protein
MNHFNFFAAAAACALLLASGVAASPYPTMAPVAQYLIADRAQEIALARTAAPASIADAAEILVLTPHGYESAVKGNNGFVCLVERAWDKGFADAEFWNPKMRAPICLNKAAAETVLPIYQERAKWVLSGATLQEIKRRTTASAAAHTPPVPGAMAYMLSRDQYLSDAGGHWYPHVMFFTPNIDASAWGANLKASPVLSDGSIGLFTLFFIPVRKWSDGTLADYGPSPAHHH